MKRPIFRYLRTAALLWAVAVRSAFVVAAGVTVTVCRLVDPGTASVPGVAVELGVQLGEGMIKGASEAAGVTGVRAIEVGPATSVTI